MEKLIPDHRRMLDGFELVDFADTDEIERLRDQLEVYAATNARWQWEYGSEVAELRALYEKGKQNQWNAATDLDWETPVSPDEWLMRPEVTLLGSACKMMARAFDPDEGRDAVPAFE